MNHYPHSTRKNQATPTPTPSEQHADPALACPWSMTDDDPDTLAIDPDARAPSLSELHDDARGGL